MSINWNSILAKAQRSMEAPQRRSEIAEKVDRAMLGIEVKPGSFDLYEVGDAFAGILWRAIQSSGLPANVEDRLADIKVEEPKKLGNGNYQITVSFSRDLQRSSMSTHKNYGYDINLARLYNNGVGHTMKQIFERSGPNKEFLEISNPNIPATHFAESAIREFTNAYGTKYGLIRIESEFDT